MDCDRGRHNAHRATLRGPALGVVERGAVRRIGGGRVCVGGEGDAAGVGTAWSVGCGGRWVMPGLVDCHSQLVHAGDRAREFEMRLEGASYEEIAKAGGGIVSTVKATRAASQDDLVAQALPRLDALIADGATTVEIKS